MEAVIIQEIRDYRTVVRDEVLNVLRSPLRIGKKDQLHSTCMVNLFFTYNRDRLVGGRPFTFDSGEVVSTAAMISEANGSMKAALEKFAESQKSPPPPSQSGAVCVGVVYWFKYRRDPSHHPDRWETLPILDNVWAHPDSWSHTIPIEERQILSDWVEYLRRALAGVLPREAGVFLMEELMASEGPERIRAAQRLRG